MRKTEITGLVRVLAMPLLLILLGIILVLAPDTAAIVAARVISWILTAVGIGYAVAAFAGSGSRVLRIITAAFCLVLGSSLMINPLILAANLGRVLGIVLAFEGFQDLMRHRSGRPMALLTLLSATILILAPMTASRLVFVLCGLLLLVIGIAQLLERLRRRKLTGGSGKSDIIDAL